LCGGSGSKGLTISHNSSSTSSHACCLSTEHAGKTIGP
jgi:hypothetical protein